MPGVPVSTSMVFPAHCAARPQSRAVLLCREALVDFECALHAYLLMTHLLLTPRKAEAVPKLIISLRRGYVQYINCRYQRPGTVWDGRYNSPLVQSESDLLACQRYIELNLVRVAMVDDPAYYRWKSYRVNGLVEPDARLTPHPENDYKVKEPLLHSWRDRGQSGGFAWLPPKIRRQTFRKSRFSAA